MRRTRPLHVRPQIVVSIAERPTPVIPTPRCSAPSLLPPRSGLKRYVHSLHCQSAVSMDVHRIDPSLALAFYLPDRAAFQDLVKKIKEVRELVLAR